MYYDNYYPSMPEDLYSYPAAGSELQPDGLQMDESISDDLQTDELQPDDLQSDMDYSEDWVNSQEYDPIIPYTDSPEDEQVFGAPMSGRTAQSMQDQPMQAQPMQAQPAMFRPDRPNPSVRPDRPNPPERPDRPNPPVRPDRPNPPERPDRPNPPRPVPPRPVPPIVNPDWSWNWGFILPGTVFPVSVARVRFYNAAIRGPIQIYINNRLVVSNLGFLDFTRFYNVAPGRYRITIYSDNNMRTPIVDTWMSFQRNTSTTVTLAGSGSNFWLQTTEQ
ncbi:DUF4397 domain-containing protein [Enterocloster clostridioformis]|uniref:DUF4397 domain-containing protein n=1 Tax=Enterocloster clostridioformis TaxID=1531 RepID=UPI000408F91C|nr:DUF4397 domain-containing protein [Enterocloster clostridioformis]